MVFLYQSDMIIILLAMVLGVIVFSILQLYLLIRIEGQVNSLYSRFRERSVKEKTTPTVTPVPLPEKLPADIDIRAAGGGLGGALQAMVRKYSLGSVTLATADGLVVATSGGSDAESDAAYYSNAFARGTPPTEKDVTLFPVNYRGSSLVGIIRAHHELSPSWMAGIEKDVIRILEAEL
jgi:hypothetical protein